MIQWQILLVSLLLNSRGWSVAQALDDITDRHTDLHQEYAGISEARHSVEDASIKISTLLKAATTAVRDLDKELAQHAQQHAQLMMLTLLKTGTASNSYSSQHLPSSKVVARFQHSWSQYFTLLSAVRADHSVTAVHAMHDSDSGLSRYVLLGDAGGNLLVVRPHGDLVAEYVTDPGNAVTALASRHIRTNESLVLTGHADGSLRVYILHQQWSRHMPAGEDVFTPLRLELEQVLPAPTDPPACAADTAELAAEDEALAAAIVALDAASSAPGRQQYTAAHLDGSINLWGSNGTLRVRVVAPTMPLALRPGINTALLTTDGLSSVRGRGSNMTVHATPCANLNASQLIAAAWEPSNPAAKTPGPVPWRGYAVSEEGQLLTLNLGQGARAGRYCEVRHARPLPYGPQHSAKHTSLAALKGYLIAATPKAVTVYNLTANVMRYGPQEVLTAPLLTLAALIGQQAKAVSQPLLATNGKRLVIVQLSERLVAIYRAELPQADYHSSALNIVAWARPLAVLAVIAIAAYQVSSRLRRSRDGDHPDMDFGADDLRRALADDMGGMPGFGPFHTGHTAMPDWSEPGRSGRSDVSGARHRSKQRVPGANDRSSARIGSRSDGRSRRVQASRATQAGDADMDAAVLRALQGQWGAADDVSRY